MLYRNGASRGFLLFTRVTKWTEYKFQKRSLDSFEKKGRAEENRYYIQKQIEQIQNLKKQLDRMQAKQDKIVGDLNKATDLIRALRNSNKDKKKTEDD